MTVPLLLACNPDRDDDGVPMRDDCSGVDANPDDCVPVCGEPEYTFTHVEACANDTDDDCDDEIDEADCVDGWRMGEGNTKNGLKQSIDNLRDMVTTAISVNLSLITIQENEVTKRLAAYAALVAIPTMVAGVYGMNFANMPELQWKYGYPVALATMVLIDVYLVYRFKKAKWM